MTINGSMYKLAIIIPTYNHVTYLPILLKNIIQYRYHIFVVDDGNIIRIKKKLISIVIFIKT